MVQSGPFVGVQIAAHSLMDEGVEHCLDLLRENAAVTAPMVSIYHYYGAMGRPIEVLPDHGVPKRDNSKRTLPSIWVRHREKYFRDSPIRHATPEPDAEYSGTDILERIAEPLRARGMQMYLRIYEPGGPQSARCIGGWDLLSEVGYDGLATGKPCNQNPLYREWMAATMTDLVENYPIDGIQFGAERPGPIGMMLLWEKPSGCFCQHCAARARANGIDLERARIGIGKLHRFMQARKAGEPLPGPDATLVYFLRLLVEYPEILAWQKQWAVGDNEVQQVVYDAIKAVRPAVRVGRHVSHVESSFDPFYRAASPYELMPSHADFVKPILYHEIFGPRLAGHYLKNGTAIFASELSMAQALDLFYTTYGHERAVMPAFPEVMDGIPPEYVCTETRRCVAALQDRAGCVPGIGLDIPVGKGWGDQQRPSDPGNLQRAIAFAFEEGAAGIVLSREYEEMHVSSLRAAGDAVRQVARL